jgi:cytochrome c oxidase subunit 1
LREESPNPSIWPLAAALATGLAFIASIFTPWAVVWGGAIVSVMLIGWFWPKSEKEDKKCALLSPMTFHSYRLTGLEAA